MTEETTAAEVETTSEPSEEQKRSGPGFILGVVLGTLAGAAAATLFSPAPGDEIRHRITDEASPLLKREEEEEGGEGGPHPERPVDRVRSVLARVRSRVREATEEGQEAARAAEEESRARYAELTHQEEQRPPQDEVL